MTPEARLEHAILDRYGAEPGLLILKNEVGSGFTGSAYHALQRALAPWGGDAVRKASQTLNQHRITYGLRPGSPDLITILAPHGRIIPVELKAQHGELSPAQRDWLALAAEHGLHVPVVRTVEAFGTTIDEARRA